MVPEPRWSSVDTLAEISPELLEEAEAHGDRREPGLLLVCSAGSPAQMAVPLHRDVLEVGRGGPGVGLRDSAVSRRHARVSYVLQDGTWCVEDHGSRNGTSVDGVKITGRVVGRHRVLRVGGSVFVLVDDLRMYQREPRVVDGHVVGAATREIRAAIEHAAGSRTLHVHGETGAGKEAIARYFHSMGPGNRGPFVAVNCAAIPNTLAERLLFGARRGAFSGADADTTGYVLDAAGGTLFLDEIGELDEVIQAKLLRVLEAREVLPLGATRPVPVEIRVCSATSEDLWARVGAGKFRADLYYRIGRPSVELLPVRERPDELAALVIEAARRIAPELAVDGTLVEACLLRPWPGNVRELLTEIGEAARAAQASDSRCVTAQHLAARAGQRPPPAEAPAVAAQFGKPRPLPADELIERALEEHRGRVASAARALGLHRNQLRRWMRRRGTTPQRDG